ncbi:MAG: D-alanyl-D-alanine dipeptidase, partial [Halomonas subglaciescola]|nr:D-alanyl-D-alanine dipeptidase [Halomonas subglaciescola]
GTGVSGGVLWSTEYRRCCAYWLNSGNKTLTTHTREFVSLPSRAPHAPSPHLTGGAVDVTLCDSDGLPLDMGTRFDEAVPESHAAALEGQPFCQARENRRLLYHAMGAQGFTNLPSEWWHFDYGDQLWAHYRGESQALYGPARLDSIGDRWRQQLL